MAARAARAATLSMQHGRVVSSRPADCGGWTRPDRGSSRLALADYFAARFIHVEVQDVVDDLVHRVTLSLDRGFN